MNVIIYARFSSHSQTEQSIEGQLKVCYEFAKRNDYNVIGEYIDRAISGKDAEKRLDFQRMIADSAKRQFNAISVYQLDIFSRNRYDSAIYKAKLRKYGSTGITRLASKNVRRPASGSTIPDKTPYQQLFAFEIPLECRGIEIMAPSGKF